MDTIDRDHFFAHFPQKLSPVPTEKQKNGINAIFDVWDSIPELDYLDWLAYALGTAWHETAKKMQPVREGLAHSDAEAYQIVTQYCLDHGKENYAKRHANGNSYYGRGYVQITHAENYKKIGKILGEGDKFYNDPDLVLDAHISAKILLRGMIEGVFRPQAGNLLSYFNSKESDWFNARDLINGDKTKIAKWTLAQWPGGRPTGSLISDYAIAFRLALKTG